MGTKQAAGLKLTVAGFDIGGYFHHAVDYLMDYRGGVVQFQL
jgi:hypothetical protein